MDWFSVGVQRLKSVPFAKLKMPPPEGFHLRQGRMNETGFTFEAIPAPDRAMQPAGCPFS